MLYVLFPLRLSPEMDDVPPPYTSAVAAAAELDLSDPSWSDLNELLPDVCRRREKEIEKEGERAREIARVQGLIGTEEGGASGGDVRREDLVAAAAEARARA